MPCCCLCHRRLLLYWPHCLLFLQHLDLARATSSLHAIGKIGYFSAFGVFTYFGWWRAQSNQEKVHSCLLFFNLLSALFKRIYWCTSAYILLCCCLNNKSTLDIILLSTCLYLDTWYIPNKENSKVSEGLTPIWQKNWIRKTRGLRVVPFLTSNQILLS